MISVIYGESSFLSNNHKVSSFMIIENSSNEIESLLIGWWDSNSLSISFIDKVFPKFFITWRIFTLDMFWSPSFVNIRNKCFRTDWGNGPWQCVDKAARNSVYETKWFGPVFSSPKIVSDYGVSVWAGNSILPMLSMSIYKNSSASFWSEFVMFTIVIRAACLMIDNRLNYSSFAIIASLPCIIYDDTEILLWDL